MLEEKKRNILFMDVFTYRSGEKKRKRREERIIRVTI